MGVVSYRLNLSVGSKIHPVFHVSLLRQASPPTDPAAVTLPEELASAPLQVPEQILARRQDKRGTTTVPQVQVRWSGLSPELATWEDTEALRRRFPAAPIVLGPLKKGGMSRQGL